jgi:sucrose-6-phosphatase
LATGWDRDTVVAIAANFADLVPQPVVEQGPFKVSYYLSDEVAVDVLPALEAALAQHNLDVNVIYSGSKDLDILPKAANKGLALVFIRQKWQFDPERTVACGDSGNDLALFSHDDNRGIIVSNARPELLEWHHSNPSDRRYLASAACAGGILEGLLHFGYF